MHSCLQSVDVSGRISLQSKLEREKRQICLKPIRIQHQKLSDVKCSECSVEDSELCEAGERFVSRGLLHAFTQLSLASLHKATSPGFACSLRYLVSITATDVTIWSKSCHAATRATQATHYQLLKLIAKVRNTGSNVDLPSQIMKRYEKICGASLLKKYLFCTVDIS